MLTIIRSHPDSPNYSKHWPSEKVVDMFAPEQVTVDTVRAWLIESGLDPQTITHSDNKGWLAFDVTVELAERLLLTEYHLYEHEDGHKTADCERCEPSFDRWVVISGLIIILLSCSKVHSGAP